MQAILIDKFGDPSRLQPREICRPQPEEEEVLIEVRAAAVNRSDVLNLQGAFPLTTLPRIPGRDFSGVLVEGPPELIGTEVWGTGGGDLGFTRDGSHAGYIVVHRDAVVFKPASFSFEEAAASGLAYLTAGSALLDLGGLSTGETVLVAGAAGGVGSSAVRIARWKGARVLGAIKDESERERAEQAGVDVVIDTSREEVSESALEATEGRGVDLALDTVGGPLFEPNLNSLGLRGRMVVIATLGERRVSFDLFDFYRKGLRLLGLNTSFLFARDCAETLRQLAPGFDAGSLQAPPIAEQYPLEEAATAYIRVAGGEAPGRILLVPSS